jgi:hypothetical protein
MSEEAIDVSPNELRVSRNLCGGGFFNTTKALATGINAVAVTGAALVKVAEFNADKLITGAVIKVGARVKGSIGVKSAVSAGVETGTVETGTADISTADIGTADTGATETGEAETGAVAGEATGAVGTSGPSPDFVAEAGTASSANMATAITNFTRALPKAFTWSCVKVHPSPNSAFEICN